MSCYSHLLTSWVTGSTWTFKFWKFKIPLNWELLPIIVPHLNAISPLQLHLLSQCIPRKFPSVPKYSLFKPWQLHSEYLHTFIMLLLTIYEQSFIYSTPVPNNTLPSFDLLVLGINLVCCQHLFVLMMLSIKSFSRWIYWDLPRGLPFLNWDITCSCMQTSGLYQRLLNYSVFQPSTIWDCQTEMICTGQLKWDKVASS